MSYGQIPATAYASPVSASISAATVYTFSYDPYAAQVLTPVGAKRKLKFPQSEQFTTSEHNLLAATKVHQVYYPQYHAALVAKFSPWLSLSKGDERHTFKDMKRREAASPGCHGGRGRMVCLCIGGVSHDPQNAVFSAGVLGLESGVQIFDCLPKGAGTVRFHIFEADLVRFMSFSKRYGFDPHREAFGTNTPHRHMRCTCTGEVIFGSSEADCLLKHSCEKRTGCPHRTCDISFALTGEERIDDRTVKRGGAAPSPAAASTPAAVDEDAPSANIAEIAEEYEGTDEHSPGVQAQPSSLAGNW